MAVNNSVFNPNATGTLGLEWALTRAGAVTLDAKSKAIASSFVQTDARTITHLATYFSALPVRGGLYAIEVYPNDSTMLPDVSGGLPSLYNEAVPNEDVSGTGSAPLWCEDDGTTTSIYSEIDEGILAQSYADYIKVGTAALDYRGRFNTGSLSLTGKRILAVELVFVASLETTWAAHYCAAGLNISGVDYTGLPGGFTVNGVYPPHDERTLTTVKQSWNYNPATKKPWTIADVQALDTSDEWFVRFPVERIVEGRVYTCSLIVWTCAETRIACGVFDDTSSALTLGFNMCAVLTPTGGAWSKSGRNDENISRKSAGLAAAKST